MPELLARSAIDFVAVEPARPRKSKASVSKRPKSRFAILGKRPWRKLAMVVTGGLLAGIAVNATMLQKGRHPAPLFAPADPVVAAVKSLPAPPPMPLARPAELTAAPPASAVSTGPLTASPSSHAPQPASRPAASATRAEIEAAPPRRDAIATLLSGVDPTATPSPRIAAAQRALQRVGFVVRPDGFMGVGTRQTIERFEKNQGLPVTGELAGRTVRELAAKSGVAIP